MSAVAKQCRTCPWRVGVDPERDIPGGYSVELHENLRGTIREGLASLEGSCQRIMACHYSVKGDEKPCAGWLYNQLGSGNNLMVRIRVMRGELPVPEVLGEQVEDFESTLPGRR